MRTVFASAVALGLLAIAAPGGHADSSATVTLRVAPEGFVVPSHWALGNPAVWIIDPAAVTTFNRLPGVAGCTVTASDANGDAQVDGGEVLDAAAAAGCISGWDSITFPCCGRFVTMVDGLEQQADGFATWWLLQVNGFASSVGIDDLNLGDGSSLEFVYYAGPL